MRFLAFLLALIAVIASQHIPYVLGTSVGGLTFVVGGIGGGVLGHLVSNR